MFDITQLKYASTKTKLILISIAAALIIALIVFICVERGIYANSMRLIRVQGIVYLKDANGNEKTLVDNMRFQSGQTIETTGASLCSIGLDDTKIVTLQENSRAEITKKGKQLELSLSAGGVFFEVTKPLSDDESFDIKTATMIVGIRGTSGYVYVDREGHECLLVTDGVVHVVGTNPVTGEKKEIDVHAGEQIKVYLYNDRTVDSIEFFLEQVSETDLDTFVLKMFAEDRQLMVKVCSDTGWSQDDLLSLYYGTYDPYSVYETESDEDESEGDPADPTSTPRATATSAASTATATAEATASATSRATARPTSSGSTPAPQTTQGGTSSTSEPSSSASASSSTATSNASSSATQTGSAATPTAGASSTTRPTSAPTSAPTTAPTTAPTAAPTSAPTAVPATPTARPSGSNLRPTATAAPTAEPTPATETAQADPTPVEESEPEMTGDAPAGPAVVG